MTSFMPIIHVVDDDESFRVAFARLLQAALYEVQHVFVSGTSFSSGKMGCTALGLMFRGSPRRNCCG
jgi:FixJ family two-component response regulator